MDKCGSDSSFGDSASTSNSSNVNSRTRSASKLACEDPAAVSFKNDNALCVDTDFDSYWEYESRNKNRNRIRVGRQYQASVPPLLKPGEKDSRRCEDLETLKWKPDKLSEECVEQYLSMAKAISRFARAIDPSLVPEKAADTPMQTALKGLSEFVTSHHPCHHDDGCQVPNPQLSGECSTKHASSSEWTPTEAQLFAQALEVCGKNFCAIKKDFLPWKPVRSLIEYYYQGKTEKTESPNPADVPDEGLDNKAEKIEPPSGCSEDVPKEMLQPKLETKELPEACAEECKIEAPEEIPCTQNLKVEEKEEKVEEMKPADSSTVGSLKFYLGGRLVLKLNAQQYSDSGSKCHWVPSNDTPKRPQLIKRVKHKKKIFEGSSSAGYQAHPSRPKDMLWDSQDMTECDTVIAKKAKLKSDCESSSEPETTCPLLYSASWTPPVANGPDVVEMDDGSSKTSEGCISPMQMNSVGEAEVKCEVSASAASSSAHSGNLCDPSEISEVKPLHDRTWIKAEPFTSGCSASQAETCSSDSNTIQSAFLKTEKSLPNQFRDGSLSQELQNSQMCTKSVCSTDSNNALCFLPRSAVSCSPSKKQWYRWASSPCAEGSESSTKVHSPSSASQTSISGQTVEDSPLDLSAAKSENENIVQNTAPSASKVSVSFNKEKICCSSPLKEEVHMLCNKTREGGPNASLSSSDSFAIHHDGKVRTCVSKTEENKVSVGESGSGENSEKCTKNDDNFSSLSEKNLDDKSKNSGDFSYPYYNVPCSCSSPKCTSSFALKENMCNKDDIECLKDHPEYLLPVTNRTASGKQPPWFEASIATYLPYYPQCYPYYLAYGVAPSSVTGSSVGELPLDLSSTCENSTEEENVEHNVPEKETSVTPKSAEALEKGMLYHLLKNRNSK